MDSQGGFKGHIFEAFFESLFGLKGHMPQGARRLEIRRNLCTDGVGAPKAGVGVMASGLASRLSVCVCAYVHVCAPAPRNRFCTPRPIRPRNSSCSGGPPEVLQGGTVDGDQPHRGRRDKHPSTSTQNFSTCACHPSCRWLPPSRCWRRTVLREADEPGDTSR